MSSIQQELWNIFTFYTLHGNPRDPSRLNRSGLIKICRDVMVLDPTMTEKALSQADLDLIFTSILTDPNKKLNPSIEKSDKLDYDEFLSCLIRIALKCYPSSLTPEDAMQQLLMDNMLPLASRRKLVDVSVIISNESVQNLFDYYRDALSDLFSFFANHSEHSAKGKNMLKTTSTAVRSFDEQKELIQEARERAQLQHMLASQMSYADFVKFSSEFGFASMGLTTLDLGDVYLSIISSKAFEPGLRKIDFNEFWEALVRCALIAFKQIPISMDDKLKGMFLYVWRHLQGTAQHNTVGTAAGGGFNSFKGSLLRGSHILNERFIAAWTKDGYRDYLDVQAPIDTTEKLKGEVISNILAGRPHHRSVPPSSSTPQDSALTLSMLNSSTATSGSRATAFGAGPPGAGSMAQPARPQVVLEMGRLGEQGDLGDERIKAPQLRLLLNVRPDIALLLKSCLEEENLDAVSSDED